MRKELLEAQATSLVLSYRDSMLNLKALAHLILEEFRVPSLGVSGLALRVGA